MALRKVRNISEIVKYNLKQPTNFSLSSSITVEVNYWILKN